MPMNLTCLKCGVPGRMAFRLDVAPRFKCEACGGEYPAAAAKQILSELVATWDPAIKWAEAVPVSNPVSPG